VSAVWPPENMLRLFRAVSNVAGTPRSTPLGAHGRARQPDLHAVGYAMGIQRDGAEEAAMAFFGDGASSQGDVLEAFVWPRRSMLVVFFCQNNQWGISTRPRPVQDSALSPRARFSDSGVRVDGTTCSRSTKSRAGPRLGARRRRTDVDRGYTYGSAHTPLQTTRPDTGSTPRSRCGSTVTPSSA